MRHEGGTHRGWREQQGDFTWKLPSAKDVASTFSTAKLSSGGVHLACMRVFSKRCQADETWLGCGGGGPMHQPLQQNNQLEFCQFLKFAATSKTGYTV